MDPPPSDHEHFLSLLEAHQRPLLKVCWAYGRTAHDRDDLLQEIVARLWAAFGRYDPGRKFSTWMFRVALNGAKYDQSVTDTPKPVQPGAGRTLAPGASTPATRDVGRRSIDEAMTRLSKTGRLDDAETVFQRLLR